MTSVKRKALSIAAIMFSLCSGLFAVTAKEVVPEGFLEELLRERVVSVIHDEGDDSLSLVPKCNYKEKISSRRVEKNESPYTAEFLYLVSKKEVLSCGVKNLQDINIGDISEVFTALSKMTGMRYRFSDSNPKGSLLYRKVSTIESVESGKDVSDMVTRNCDGMKIFCYQHDRLLGNLKFLLDYEMSGDELYLSILNKNNLGLLGFNACKKENLRINIHVIDLGEDMLFYISADANYENVLKIFSIRKIIKTLMNERLDAIYRWFFTQF